MALALACLVGVALAAFGTQGALAKDAKSSRKPADGVRALVLGEARSPVLDDLKRSQGWRLTRAANAQGRGNSPAKYDALVVDGDALSPEQLGEGTLVDGFADAGRWVLALDVDPADYGRGLKDHTGFTVEERSQKSSMFLFSRQMLHNTPRVLMIEAKSLRPLDSGNLGQEALRKATTLQTREVASTATLGASAERSALAEEYAPQGGRDVPSQIQHVGFTYADVMSQAPPPDGYWDKQGCDSGLICSPNPGSQTPSWTFNHMFDVYLNNPGGKDDFQYVTYALDGEFTPKKRTQQFFQMSEPFSVGLDSYKYLLERAWWTGMVDVAAKPEGPTEENLIYQATTPATPNEETEYKTGQEFEIGFSASKEGPEVEGNYKVNYEESHPIRDWGVENTSTSADNEFSWMFSSRSPCDARPEHYEVSRCFDSLARWTPKVPNDLSLGQLQVHAEGRWRTKDLLTDEEGKNNLFAVETPVTLIDTVCRDVQFFTCVIPERRIFRSQVNDGPPTGYRFDIGVVNPVPVESLILTPNPANGARNDKVTGTVTLERPAPMDISVDIFSNSANATVGAPDPNGASSKTITIAKGNTSGTFEAVTNDNKLSPGQHTTATITAFYTKPTSTQLRVEAPRKGSP